MTTEHHNAWYDADGNNTHAITYPLTEQSIVVDLGAFKGVWAKQIIQKYNPYVYLLEPVDTFYNSLVNKFESNPKVHIINSGIAVEDCNDILYLNDDSTSKFTNQHENKIQANFISIESLLNIINKNVDLVQINIEGAEYDLLDYMIDTNLIENFTNIQIQFHTFIDDAEKRRKQIQKKLSKKFTKLFDYPFVFEGWSKK